MESPGDIKQKNLTVPIIIVSITIPIAVALIILVPQVKIHPGFSTSMLPVFHAILNSTTAILLLASLYFIRHRMVRAHKTANLIAVTLSAVFLVSYVLFHITNPSVKFGDLDHNGVLSDAEKGQAGSLRYVYYFILTSHILLSGIIIPFVLFTMQRAFQEKFQSHKQLARITWPMWFYVAVTGVVVYFMISPYY